MANDDLSKEIAEIKLQKTNFINKIQIKDINSVFVELYNTNRNFKNWLESIEEISSFLQEMLNRDFTFDHDKHSDFAIQAYDKFDKSFFYPSTMIDFAIDDFNQANNISLKPNSFISTINKLYDYCCALHKKYSNFNKDLITLVNIISTKFVLEQDFDLAKLQHLLTDILKPNYDDILHSERGSYKELIVNKFLLKLREFGRLQTELLMPIAMIEQIIKESINAKIKSLFRFDCEVKQSLQSIIETIKSLEKNKHDIYSFKKELENFKLAMCKYCFSDENPEIKAELIEALQLLRQNVKFAKDNLYHLNNDEMRSLILNEICKELDNAQQDITLVNELFDIHDIDERKTKILSTKKDLIDLYSTDIRSNLTLPEEEKFAKINSYQNDIITLFEQYRLNKPKDQSKSWKEYIEAQRGNGEIPQKKNTKEGSHLP